MLAQSGTFTAHTHTVDVPRVTRVTWNDLMTTESTHPGGLATLSHTHTCQYLKLQFWLGIVPNITSTANNYIILCPIN